MPRYEGLEDMKVWDRRFGSQRITTPSIKTLNHPLSSTFIHSNPLIKISVRNNSLTKPSQIPFKSLLSLFWEGIKPSSWIHIVHTKPGLLDIVGKPSYLAYEAIWHTRFVITLGIMGTSCYSRRNLVCLIYDKYIKPYLCRRVF